ncbi:tyrosine-type recombinase/integrase [Streptomyces sp. NPDC101213]|uniref:tyrosine-type recombinase/integrase n=1 Tax=Streptomyces sp. NPDC101213 TaxID=3366130 RepID=UPI0038038134
MTAVAAEPCGVTLEQAWREWLDERFSEPDKARTRRQYELTMRRVSAHLGAGDRDVATVTGHEYFKALRALWGTRKPATWNTNRATLGSFLKWVRDFAAYAEVRLPARCTSKEIRADRTKAVDREDLDVLWEPDAAALRERTLWRCMYESSSRADALLSLDVTDVELDRRRARVRIKGGDTAWLHFGEQGTRLLREYIGARTTGPVFLTDSRPWNWRDRERSDRGPGDRCRLSYNRAEEVFKKRTAELGFHRDGLAFDFLTLHQLRHSRLSHLAEDGVDTPVLQAISNHKDPRTLHRNYTKVSSRTVARTMADADRREAERHRKKTRRRPVQPRPRTRAARLTSRRLRR